MSKLIKIAGIDPSLRATGYGILNYCQEKNELWPTNCGVVKTPKRFKGIEAIEYMIEQMKEISSRECFKDCDHVVIEFPATFYSPKFFGGSLTPIAGISGACMILFQGTGENRVIVVYPANWNGCKKKTKTSEIISELLGNPKEWKYDDKIKVASEYEHVIDAIGMAYWLAEKTYFPKTREKK